MSRAKEHPLKITLAYPYDNHKPDETIEVADTVGRQMVHDGVARPADNPPKSAPKKET